MQLDLNEHFGFGIWTEKSALYIWTCTIVWVLCCKYFMWTINLCQLDLHWTCIQCNKNLGNRRTFTYSIPSQSDTFFAKVVPFTLFLNNLVLMYGKQTYSEQQPAFYTFLWKYRGVTQNGSTVNYHLLDRLTLIAIFYS